MSSPLIDGPFLGVRFARGDDADDLPFGSVTMNNDEHPETPIKAEEYEAVFVSRVVGVVNQERALVGEDRLRVFNRYTVLPEIDLGFLGVPFKPDA
jgi:hypothetical protein